MRNGAQNSLTGKSDHTLTHMVSLPFLSFSRLKKTFGHTSKPHHAPSSLTTYQHFFNQKNKIVFRTKHSKTNFSKFYRSSEDERDLMWMVEANRSP